MTTPSHYLRDARAGVMHLVDLKRTGHSPTRTELRVCPKTDRPLWTQVTKRKAGAPEANKNAAKGDASSEETNVDNINNCSPERPTGTSAAAGLRTLQKHAAGGRLP